MKYIDRKYVKCPDGIERAARRYYKHNDNYVLMFHGCTVCGKVIDDKVFVPEPYLTNSDVFDRYLDILKKYGNKEMKKHVNGGMVSTV